MPNNNLYCRARIWIMACGREDLSEMLEDLHNRHYHVCGLHFERKMFMNDLRNRLYPHAVPTLFPTLEGSSTSDHSYSAFRQHVPASIQGKYI